MVDFPSEAMANPQSDNPADHAANAALYVKSSDVGRRYSDVVNGRRNYPSTDGTGPARPASSWDVSPRYGGLTLASAGAAASLAHANHRPVEPWRPTEHQSAGKAALRANRQLREASEQPESGNSDTRASASHSAAEKVMAETGKEQNGWIPAQSKGAWHAATGAMSGGMQKSSDSGFDNPDSIQRRASHAMSAAVKSHRHSQVGGTIPENESSHTQGELAASRGFTTESAEKSKQDTRHAAVISMAKQIHDAKAKIENERNAGTEFASREASRKGRPRMSSQPGLSTNSEPTPYRFGSHLHEHAQRLVAQRMSSLYDENQAYRDYYGVSSPSRSRSRMSGRFRRRSSSDSDASRYERERHRRIRSEMSTISDNLDEVDSKRKRDRASLMAAAKRNVELKLENIDELVCADTGRPPPAMVKAWEDKLKERRESGGSDHIDTSGMVPVGGGRYIERDDVHSLAKEKLQPEIADMRERAEEERARMTAERLDKEEKERMASIEKEREASMQEEQRHMKELQKQQGKEKKSKNAEKHRQEKGDYRLWKKRSKEPKGKERATEDSVSPERATALLPGRERYYDEEDQEPRPTFAGYHRYANDPNRVKNGESSRSQPSPVQERESFLPVRREKEPSPSPSTTKSDAERLVDWFKNRKQRTSAEKAEDSGIRQGGEEQRLSHQGDNYVTQKPLMGEAAKPAPEPGTGMVAQENGEGPSHATALRSHPVTNGDMQKGEASGGGAESGAIRGQSNNIRETKSAKESGTKAQNRRSKRWSWVGLLGRNGKTNGAEETEAPENTTVERGDGTTHERAPRTSETKASEPNVRDSRFVEDL